MTNYEKIKAMSIEEMAKFLDPIISNCDTCPYIEICLASMNYDYDCVSNLIKYLESEAEDNG